MKNKRLALTLAALTLVAWLVACRPTPPPPQASAWVSHGRPGWGHVLTVYAKLTQGEQGVSGAQMYCIIHDADADRRWPSEGFERTGEDGIASTTTIVMENPEGAEVTLDVYLIHEGHTYPAQTSFVSHC